MSSATAVMVSLPAGCSSGSSGSSGSAPSSAAPPSSSLAADASAQDVARALGCTPSAAPSTYPASPSASSSNTTASGFASGFAGATVLRCSDMNLKYGIIDFPSTAQKKKALALISGLAKGSGLAVCGTKTSTWTIGTATQFENQLTPAQRTIQRKTLLKAHSATGCQARRLGGTATN